MLVPSLFRVLACITDAEKREDWKPVLEFGAGVSQAAASHGQFNIMCISLCCVASDATCAG